LLRWESWCMMAMTWNGKKLPGNGLQYTHTHIYRSRCLLKDSQRFPSDFITAKSLKINCP
jgi:hypothetical protein